MEGARADKWLWATRFFKTRVLAAETCSEEKLRRGGHVVKPSTSLHVGDLIEIPFPEGPGHRTIKIKALIEKRVSAPLAQACYEDLTEPAVYEALKLALQQKKDAGNKPTKKERRKIGEIRGFWDWRP